MQSAVVAKETIQCDLLGQNVHVDVEVDFNFRVVATFTYLHRPYNFIVTKWMGKGFTTFASAMLAVYNNGVFGSIDRLGAPTQTTSQRKNAIIQSVRDVMRHLDQILQTHQRSVLDYAVWYRENRKGFRTYEQYIQLITCLGGQCGRR
jgi:hypothetical protein